MIVLALGVVLMAALHLGTSVPALKLRLKSVIGERGYVPAFGIGSLAAIIIIMLGWRASTFVPLYDPPAWGRYANFLLSFIAFLSLGIFLFRGRLHQHLRFPMGLAVALWATGHLFANGDLASLILFGGLLVYAVVHIALAAAYRVQPTGDVRQGHDLLSLLAGAALYGVMAQLHQAVTGVPILTLTR